MGASVGFIAKMSLPGAGEREEKPCWWFPSFLGFSSAFFGDPELHLYYHQCTTYLFTRRQPHPTNIKWWRKPLKSFLKMLHPFPVELRPAAQKVSVPWRFIRLAGTTPHKTQCYFIHLQPFNTINEDIQPSQNQPKTAKINQTSTPNQPTNQPPPPKRHKTHPPQCSFSKTTGDWGISPPNTAS